MIGPTTAKETGVSIDFATFQGANGDPIEPSYFGSNMKDYSQYLSEHNLDRSQLSYEDFVKRMQEESKLHPRFISYY